MEIKGLQRGYEKRGPHPGRRSQRGSQRAMGCWAEKQMGRGRRGDMGGRGALEKMLPVKVGLHWDSWWDDGHIESPPFLFTYCIFLGIGLDFVKSI